MTTRQSVEPTGRADFPPFFYACWSAASREIVLARARQEAPCGGSRNCLPADGSDRQRHRGAASDSAPATSGCSCSKTPSPPAFALMALIWAFRPDFGRALQPGGDADPTSCCMAARFGRASPMSEPRLSAGSPGTILANPDVRAAAGSRGQPKFGAAPTSGSRK